MTEDEPYQEEPISVPRRYARALLLWLPAAALALCMGLALLLPALQQPSVPLTGAGLPHAPTLTPDLLHKMTPEPAPSLAPGLTYKEVAATHLRSCSPAFHDVLLLEEAAHHTPNFDPDALWREDIAQAMALFQQDCSPLGALPAAPASYDEADRWLKLAAGEVDSAAEAFAGMLAQDDFSRIGALAEQLYKFAEYTQNAETIIDRLEDREDI